MFKKLIFIAATAIFFTQSVVYGEESIKPIDNPVADIAEISEMENDVALEIEKLITTLEAHGYSKEQILDMVKTTIEQDLISWQEVANNCLHKAMIVALVALTVWGIKISSAAYTNYTDLRLRRDRDEYLEHLRYMRLRDERRYRERY